MIFFRFASYMFMFIFLVACISGILNACVADWGDTWRSVSEAAMAFYAFFGAAALKEAACERRHT